MSIKKELFGKYDGAEIYNIILDNGCGLKAEIITLGGIVKNLYFDGTDVVLGRNTLEEYEDNDGCLGALIGRNSNRIAGGRLTIGGKECTLACNDHGIANLHGGNVGFNKKVWDAELFDAAEPSVALSLVSPDGDEGFPGEVSVKVTYTLTADNTLKIHYEGTTDADTVLNMTNHSYFNLNVHDSGSIDGHTLCMSSDFYTPNNDSCIPTGEVLSVTGSPFDFRNTAKMGDRFASSHEQIKKFGGFDHNFALSGRGYRHFGTFIGDKTGIKMDMYTDLPGVQIYTANMLDEDDRYKNGAKYGVHNAACFETQYFPNAFNYSHFEAPYLGKGERYETVTAYKFSK